MPNVSTSQPSGPLLTIENLKLAGLDLCRYIGRAPSLPDAERVELFATIGEISYISDVIELAISDEAFVRDEAFDKLILNADKLVELSKPFA